VYNAKHKHAALCNYYTGRAAQYGMAEHGTAQHSMAQHGTAWDSTAWRHILQQVTAQHDCTGQHTYRDGRRKAGVFQGSLDAGNSPFHVPCLHFKPAALNEEPHKGILRLGKYAGRSTFTSAARSFLF